MNPTIRQENPNDFEIVFELNKLAFNQENEAVLVNHLRKSEAFVPELSLVAEIDNKLVGHILFTKIQIIDDENHETESLALAPMAVHPDFQKRAIGSELIKAGLEKAKELNFQSVIVLGHEHYYPKFGFEPAEKWNIKPPFEVPANVFMAIELFPDSLENVHGVVRYAKEFELVG